MAFNIIYGMVLALTSCASFSRFSHLWDKYKISILVKCFILVNIFYPCLFKVKFYIRSISHQWDYIVMGVGLTSQALELIINQKRIARGVLHYSIEVSNEEFKIGDDVQFSIRHASPGIIAIRPESCSVTNVETGQVYNLFNGACTDNFTNFRIGIERGKYDAVKLSIFQQSTSI